MICRRACRCTGRGTGCAPDGSSTTVSTDAAEGSRMAASGAIGQPRSTTLIGASSAVHRVGTRRSPGAAGKRSLLPIRRTASGSSSTTAGTPPDPGERRVGHRADHVESLKTRSCWPPARPGRVDVIVAATGFEVSRFLAPMDIHGRSASRLRESGRTRTPARSWGCRPGLPQLLHALRPQRPGGHGGSLIGSAETQTDYLARLLRRCSSRARGCRVRSAAYERPQPAGRRGARADDLDPSWNDHLLPQLPRPGRLNTPCGSSTTGR